MQCAEQARKRDFVTQRTTIERNKWSGGEAEGGREEREGQERTMRGAVDSNDRSLPSFDEFQFALMHKSQQVTQRCADGERLADGGKRRDGA